MPVTLKDIANELGLSPNTVSRALRDMPDIGAATTSLVKETATRLGYQKNLAASRLRTNKSLLLGMVVTNICNPVFAPMIKGAETTCSQSNYTLLLGNSNENAKEEDKVISNMLKHGIDGLLLVPSMINSDVISKLNAAKIPYVILQRKFENISSNYVRSDDFSGGVLAAEHLYNLGHRKFLYVAAPMHISSSSERYRGFLSFLKEKDLSENSIVVLECDGTRIGSKIAVDKWIKQHSDYHKLSATAIFCFSDYVAYGAYSALAKYNISIPNDISVIGYDNNEYADMTLPPLTTVDIRPYKIGQYSASQLIKIINTEDSNNIFYETVIPPKLIIRSSTTNIIVND